MIGRIARKYVRDTWAIPTAVFVGLMLVARVVLWVYDPTVTLIPYLP